ncbi:MAG: hypothetical protein NVS1B10_05390 [Candidatus Saccharimonadales bacterium]
MYNRVVQIKIIQLNVWSGGLLFSQIVDFLKRQDSDIVCLQEVYSSNNVNLPNRFRTYQALQSLGYRYSNFAEAYKAKTSYGAIAQGNAIFSKHNISSFSQDYLVEPKLDIYDPLSEKDSEYPRVLQFVKVKNNDVEYNIFNFHGICDKRGSYPSTERQKMTDIIIGKIKNLENVILVGDTNAQSDNPVIAKIEQYLTSVFGHQLKSTFNMRHKTDLGYAEANVDQIFISKNFKVISKSCPDDDLSDHKPLVVVIDLDSE